MAIIKAIINKTCDFYDNIVDDHYDICLITETWLNQNDSTPQVESTPPGYTFDHLPRDNGTGGGVGLVCKEDMKPQKSQSIPKFSSFEHCELILNIGSDKILVVIIYRPPYSERNRNSVNKFLEEFGTLMESLITSPVKLLIGGDFNFHIDDTTSLDTIKFLDLLECHNLSNHVWR